ncbi:hypothetical protein GCM10028778_22580 [Barrientosiimonas marina]
MEQLPNQVKVIKDTAEGEYADLIGEEITVVEELETDDPYVSMYLAVTNRMSPNPYLNDNEEIILEDDIKVISYH